MRENLYPWRPHIKALGLASTCELASRVARKQWEANPSDKFEAD
jgi:hypothetical protein